MHVARIEDWVVILGVLFFVVALYGTCIFLLIRPLIAPKQIVPKLGPLGYCAFAAGLSGILCMAYAYFIAPYQLAVTHLTLQMPELGHLEQPIRIVQFSDTHCDEKKRLEDRIPDVIAKEKPDLIFFTGDAMNTDKAYSVFEELIHKVMRIAPTFAVKGDWDFAITDRDVLHDTGVKVLGHEVVDVRGTKLSIVGADSGSSVRDSLDGAPKNLPTFVLFHNPDGDIIVGDDAKEVLLYCCGHTHGGQIALPFYGALITQSIQGKKYDTGMHRLGKTYVYTNRGIGMEGHFPRLRFFAEPEITVFDLTGT